MKKKFLLVSVLFLFSGLLFAAPFGLTMGMNLEEIKGACGGKRPENVQDDCYRIYPEKNHPLFEEYYAYVDEVEGLYYIKAVSARISVNEYGTELKEKFNEINARVSKTYGTPKITDEIIRQTSFRSDSNWLYSLGEGSRVLSARWENANQLKDDLVYVYLYVSSEKYYYGWVNLEYRFTNASAVEDSQDDVF
ncbi:MAG: hypothetical protein IKQ43_07515 [Treponema sp.]|nr:hypothetical protein [Treponema sp.]